MLLVKTKIKESKIHGIGLFSDQFIPKGTVIFKESVFTKKFTEEEYALLPELQKEFVNHFCYFLGGIWRCSLDNDRFMNHSQTPNTTELDDVTTVASQDINIDEEITTNYDMICEDHNTHGINILEKKWIDSGILDGLKAPSKERIVELNKLYGFDNNQLKEPVLDDFMDVWNYNVSAGDKVKFKPNAVKTYNAAKDECYHRVLNPELQDKVGIVVESRCDIHAYGRGSFWTCLVDFHGKVIELPCGFFVKEGSI